MRRLEEVLRQMCSAAKAIGNTELENKFAEGEVHPSTTAAAVNVLEHSFKILTDKTGWI